MNFTWKLRSAKTTVLAALLGAVAFLVNATAQEKDAPKAWLTAGYVRPGADGKADDPLGGTIYYAVYQLSEKADPNDPYKTGFADFAKNFVAGAGTTKSPTALVPEKNQPKYLYVYEIVNDRGLDQSKDGVRLAANTDVKARDIGNMILKLPIDASKVHSWGYFKNAGFTLNAFDRGSSGQLRPVAIAEKTPLAVSANPSILSALAGQGHARMAKPVEFTANSGFSVDKAGKGLKSSAFADELSNRKTKLVAWEAEALKAVDGGDIPESVSLEKFTDNDKTKASAVLRASFAGAPLKVGRHSVLVGFTSNVPPGQDLVRIQDADTAKKGTGIRAVALDDIDFGAGGMVALPKDGAKDGAAAGIANLKPSNLVVSGVVSPGDVPSATKLVDLGSYKTFGGTVYFTVFRRSSTVAGDTWGVGRENFDSLFNPGESHRATFSPRLDTDAEYIYLYQVVNDRGFHDLSLPQNKATIVTPVAMDNAEERAPITREVASFSLFLRTDPRLITSWGFFDDSGFGIKVPDEVEIKQVGLDDPNAKPAKMEMAVSANLSILDSLYPTSDKVYKPWSQPTPLDFSRTSLSVGKDTLNINGNRIRPVANDRAGGLRFVANKTLDRVKAEGGVRPDYAQIIYFDGQNPTNGATIDGITLGPAEVARALFKVEWLNKPIKEGQQSVIFGFTSNAEPVRAPVRLKDLKATIDSSSQAQERVFLSPAEIKALALKSLENARAAGTGTGVGAAAGVGAGAGVGAALGVGAGAASGKGIATVGNAAGTGTGQATGIVLASLSADSADTAAVAVANGLGQGILPVGLSTLALASVGEGVAISPSVATPNAGSANVAASGGASAMAFPPVTQQSGQGGMGGAMGGFGGGVGAIGAARMPIFGGGGSGGGSGGGTGGSSGTSNQGSSGSGSDAKTGITNNINFNVSQANQQTQNQQQSQWQKQNQNQHQNQNNGNNCGCHANVVPAPAGLLLGLLGVPGIYFAYRRRRNSQREAASADSPFDETADAVPEEPGI